MRVWLGFQESIFGGCLLFRRRQRGGGRMRCPRSHFLDSSVRFPQEARRFRANFWRIPGEWVLDYGDRVRVRIVAQKIGRISELS